MSDAKELSDAEKRRLAEMAAQQLQPLLAKYELDEKIGLLALFEAYQLGIKFAIGETKRMEQELSDGSQFLSA